MQVSPSNKNGIVYIVYGNKAKAEFMRSTEALKISENEYPVHVIDEEFPEYSDNKIRSRLTKTSLWELTPFENTLYLDCDTRIRGDISTGFKLLEEGWDIVVTLSTQQDSDAFWHIGSDEKRRTQELYGFLPLQFQGGVLYFTKNKQTKKLFEEWNSMYHEFADEDQGAFARALRVSPVRMALLGRPFNGGAIINHLYGRCRE